MPRKVHELPRKPRKRGPVTRNLAGLPPEQRPRKMASAAELRALLMEFLQATDENTRPNYYNKNPTIADRQREQELAAGARRLRRQAVAALNLDLDVITKLRKAEREVVEWTRSGRGSVSARMSPHWEDVGEHLSEIRYYLEGVQRAPHQMDYDKIIVVLGHHQLWFVPLSKRTL